MRISREQMFMMMARTVSLRATCPRLNVGAIIVYENNIVSMGYNGSLPNEPHCTDEGCLIEAGGCVRTTHAEMNAIRRVPKELRLKPLDIYITHSPCSNCAQVLVDNLIRRVYYEVPYRKQEPVMKLIDNGIEVFQVTPSGHVIPQEEL